MTVNYKPFQSELGFKSPGFEVDETGSFTIANLNTTSSIKISGQTVITSNSLGSNILSSSLTSVGTLTGLTVTGATPISLTSSDNLALTGDEVSITSTALAVTSTGTIVLSSGNTGTIDNINIGTTSPGTGNFTTLTATENLFVGSQNIKSLSIAMAVALS